MMHNANKGQLISLHRRSLLTASSIAVGTSAIVLLTGCGPQAKTNSPAASNPAASNPANASIAAAPLNSNNLPVPGIPPLASSQMPTLPIAGLNPASDPKAVSAKAQAQPKQGDPFAATESMVFTMAPSPLAQTSKTSKTKAANTTAKGKTKTAAQTGKQPSSPVPQPVAQAIRNPSLAQPGRPVRNNVAPIRNVIPTVPQPRTIAAVPAPIVMQPIAPPPSVNVPVIAVPNVAVPQAAPAAAPIAPRAPQAEAIAITGVLQTNGRTMVIAQAPNSSARYVEAGDSIGGVRVKSIQVSRSGDPTVVLEQNGVTVTKSVGAR